jgi:predicted CoA-binding protein
MRDAISTFFSSSAYAVVGVSANRKKFGNVVYRNMLEKGFVVYPVNPKLGVVEDRKCYPSVLELPSEVKSVVTVVPPSVTEEVLSNLHNKGVRAVWMQPGSESESSIKLAREHDIVVVHRECILMHLEPVKSIHAAHRWVNKLVGVYPK